MSEITMPAELMAAVNIFGGTSGASPLIAEDGAQIGSFGSVLGLLMADAAQIQAVPDMPQMSEISEAYASPDFSLPDILAAALSGDENSELPDLFSETGVTAFLRSVSLFLENDGEMPAMTDFEAVWEDVSPEERSAFTELLCAAADLSKDGSSDIDAAPADIADSIVKLTLRAAKKSDRKNADTDIPADEAVLIPVTDIRLCPVQVVSFDYNENTDVNVEVTAGVEAVVSESSADLQDSTEITINPGKADDVDIPTYADNKLTDDFGHVIEMIHEADPKEVADIFAKLADKLNASAAVKVPDADISDPSPDADHIEFGRQNLQGFMTRVNRPLEKDLPAEAVIPQDTEITAFSESIPVSEDEEVSSQIIHRIDLYRDIFTENLSEREIEMKLSPEELGDLEIRIRRSDKGFEITFTAEKAEAAELISRKTSELAEAMASRGIALKEISVSRQIVTDKADGSLTGNSFTPEGGLYGGAQGQNGSDRHFTPGGSYSSDGSSEQQDDTADNIFNREAKLWVSA